MQTGCNQISPNYRGLFLPPIFIILYILEEVSQIKLVNSQAPFPGIASIYFLQSENMQISQSKAPQQAVADRYFGQCLEVMSESDHANQYYNAPHSGLAGCPELEIVRLLN